MAGQLIRSNKTQHTRYSQAYSVSPSPRQSPSTRSASKAVLLCCAFGDFILTDVFRQRHQRQHHQCSLHSYS